NLVSLVGLQTMDGKPVFMRIDRYGPDAELMRRAKDPDRDLAAIGDHQLAKHGHQRSSSSSASTGFSRVPIGPMVARTQSPGLRNVPVAEPTPDGVPVAITSPRCSVISSERNATIADTGKTISAVDASCFTCPLTDSLIGSACGLGTTSAER